MKHITALVLLFILVSISCHSNLSEEKSSTPPTAQNKTDTVCLTGASQPVKYLNLLKNKSVSLVVNNSSLVYDSIHLVDFLQQHKIKIQSIFAPEHGFRGEAEAGEHVKNNIDKKSGLQIISIYGKNNKPTAEQLSNTDIIVFDIQDVGCRFFTYISTMHYIMEAAAENNIPVIVFDRPNPNGDYIDGPLLNIKYRSFVGMHPVPVVYGMTIGEFAQMINGEKWLKNGIQCDLKIIPLKNYGRGKTYALPIKPSPNLPTDISVRLYPSLCFFEATDFSIGRGTYFPFQVIGYPDEKYGNFTFIPKSIPGMAKYPKQENKTCYGVDLRNEPIAQKMTLKYLFEFYRLSGNKPDFFSRPEWINLLSGTDKFAKDFLSGKTEQEIKASWKPDIEFFKQKRKKYLLYKDF